MNHAAHIGFDVAGKGMMALIGLQLAIASHREAEARRRRDGIHAVADIAARLQESRQLEEQACDAAATLAEENARLRRDLAAARAHAAQMEAAVISYAERNGLI